MPSFTGSQAARLDENDEKDDSAETFSEAVEKEEPGRLQALLSHTRADAARAWASEGWLVAIWDAARSRRASKSLL